MKDLTFIFLFIPLILWSQVGINTANPQAALDINVTDQGFLPPRVEILSKTDVANVTRPDGTAPTIGTIVYKQQP